MADAGPHDTGHVVPAITSEEHLHAAKAKRVVPLWLQEDGQYSNDPVPVKAGTVDSFTNVEVDTDATLIVDASDTRRKLSISRGTGPTLWVGPDDTVSVGKGIPVTESGAGFSDSGHGIATTAWYGIVGSGTLDVTLIEWNA